MAVNAKRQKTEHLTSVGGEEQLKTFLGKR